MKTIDNLLYALTTNISPPLEDLLSRRDSKLLRSLTSAVNNNWYFTEKQAGLIIKVLTTNQSVLSLIDDNIQLYLVEPIWARSFRQLANVRKMNIVNTDIEKIMVIQCTYTPLIRSIVKESKIGVVFHQGGSSYKINFTEQNIATLVPLLKIHEFEIDDEILDLYDTIMLWNKTEIEHQYDIKNTDVLQHLPDTLVNDTKLIKHDRRFKYQYISNYEHNGNSLTSAIVNRKSSKVWIDKSKYSLTEVVASLIELKRVPILFVFDTFKYDLVTQQLKDVSIALSNNDIDDNIGIYFRLPSRTKNGSMLNEFIANKNFNCRLDHTTKVVGIDYCKLPKFLFDWEPMSVVSINNNLRNSKTAVYANRCDLILTYSEYAPII